MQHYLYLFQMLTASMNSQLHLVTRTRILRMALNVDFRFAVIVRRCAPYGGWPGDAAASCWRQTKQKTSTQEKLLRLWLERDTYIVSAAAFSHLVPESLRVVACAGVWTTATWTYTHLPGKNNYVQSGTSGNETKKRKHLRLLRSGATYRPNCGSLRLRKKQG